MWDHLRRILPALGEAGLLTFLVKTGRAADMQATIKKNDFLKPNMFFTSSCVDLFLFMFLHLLFSLYLSIHIHIYIYIYLCICACVGFRLDGLYVYIYIDI